MTGKKLLILPILLLFMIPFACAAPNIAITPNTAYQYVPTTFYATINDSAALTSITWVFNGVLVQDITANDPYNYTITYNGISSILLNLTITDDNGVYLLNKTINYKPYLPPKLSDSIFPNHITEKTEGIFSIGIEGGSFPVNSITWQFLSVYVKNQAFNGTNYQEWAYNRSGIYASTIQVCDSNNFCTSGHYYINVSSSIPNSYWKIKTAQLQNVSLPNKANLALDFVSINDTSPIASVELNWGDLSTASLTTYVRGTKSDSYTHEYVAKGIYAINATICDTLNNCITQQIGLIEVSKNLQSDIMGFLFNTGVGRTINLSDDPIGLGGIDSTEAIKYVGIIVLVGIIIYVGYMNKDKLMQFRKG